MLYYVLARKNWQTCHQTFTTEKKTSAGKRSSTGRKGPHRHFLIENLFPSHHYQLVGLAERPSTILGSVLSSFQASEGDTNVELHSYQVRNGNKYGPKSVCSAADQRAQVHCCACWEPFAPLWTALGSQFFQRKTEKKNCMHLPMKTIARKLPSSSTPI